MGGLALEGVAAMSIVQTQEGTMEHVDARLRDIGERMAEHKVLLQNIARDLERGHERMRDIDEEQDAMSERITAECKILSDRISILERTVPLLSEYGEWVKRGVYGIFGVLGALIVTIVGGVIVWALTR